MVLMEAGTRYVIFSNSMEYIILYHWPRASIGQLPAGKDT